MPSPLFPAPFNATRTKNTQYKYCLNFTLFWILTKIMQIFSHKNSADQTKIEHINNRILNYIVNVFLTVVLQYCSTVVLQYCSTVVLQYCSTVVLQYCSTVVLQCCSTVVLQYCSTVVMQYSTVIYSTRYLKISNPTMLFQLF